MGITEDIESSVRERTVPKIHGQPTQESLAQLRRALAGIVTAIPTGNGGGQHGHLGIIMATDEYIELSAGGEEYIEPIFPGHYPAAVSANAATRAREEAEHKGEVKEYETHLGVSRGVKAQIEEAVDPEWLEELQDPVLGLVNVTPLQMIEHLILRGGAVDYVDIVELKTERDAPWEAETHIAMYFVRVERAVAKLEKAEVESDQIELAAQALYQIKQSGMMSNALLTWDAKSDADQTWPNLKEHFIKAYADRRKHEEIETKQHFHSASQAKEAKEDLEAEYANATNEIIQNMMGPILQQMADQSKQNTEILQELKTIKTSNGNGGGGGNGGKKKCTHCGKPRHKGGDSKCWELEANKDTRPTNWKSVKES